MKITVIGTGYVGLIAGLGFAKWGNEVVCLDVIPEKIEKLQKGICPIYEPGAEVQLADGLASGRLRFTCDVKEAVEHGEMIFIAVGTPEAPDGSADMKYVYSAVDEIAEYMQSYKLVVDKSTVPVGTARVLKERMAKRLAQLGKDIPFDVASNPEFLKEGAAIKDFMSPDRVVVGVESERAKEMMSKLYRPFLLNNFRVIFTDIPSAEMIKYAANSMLATRISFMNDIANLCELVGADVNMVRKGIGSDSRIGNKFLYPGCGYGGSCFPKDVKALIKTAEKNGYPMGVLKAVEEVNERQKTILYTKLRKHFDSLEGRTIALWGLSFKPETDDMREATSLVMIDLLRKAGAVVKVFDPVAIGECKRRVADRVVYAKDMYEAVIDADALLLLTEWKQFRLPSWAVIKKVMRQPLLLDGRNIYDAKELGELGFTYECIGK